MKLKNKMKNKNKVGSSIITSSSHDEDDWLVCEILTRLSVKSLSRFRSVCKRWCSLIQQDQNFISLHLTRSQTRPFPPCRLFIVVPVPKTKEEEEIKSRSNNIDTSPYKNFHITADLLFEEDNKGHVCTKVEVDTVREISYSSYTMISKPVNGLICLVDSTINYDVRIYNISTGEISPSLESTLLDEREYVNATTSNHPFTLSTYYGFGFNPATDEHKLVCVWIWDESNVMELGESPNNNNIICEVLTIGHHHQDGGNNRWRRIAEVPPPYKLRDNSVYVNGVIYWKTLDIMSWGWGFYNRPAHIVAFDVGSEKFRAITISNTIPYQVPGVNHYKGYVNLLQVDGRLAILIGTEKGVFYLCIYKDDYKQAGEEINTTSTTSSCKNNESWSEVSIGELPFSLGCKDVFRFDSVVGSSDMIILTLRHKYYCGREMKNKKKKCFSIYCCNWKKGSWTELDLSGFPSSVPHFCTRTFFATSFETLFSPSQIPQLIWNPNGRSKIKRIISV